MVRSQVDMVSQDKGDLSMARGHLVDLDKGLINQFEAAYTYLKERGSKHNQGKIKSHIVENNQVINLLIGLIR